MPEKPTRNPEYDKQVKVHKDASSRHQSMTIGSKSSTYTHEEKMGAYNRMYEELDKLHTIPMFNECVGCDGDTYANLKCLECINLYLSKGHKIAP